MEHTESTCGNGHSFDGVSSGKACPVCGSRERIFLAPVARATARALGRSACLETEGLRDVYERHMGWIVPAILVSIVSAAVTHVLLTGWIALFVTASSPFLVWVLRRREFEKKQVRVVERHY